MPRLGFASVVLAVLAVLAAGTSPAAATPTGDDIDRKMNKALDEVYQRDLPGWDASGGDDDLLTNGGPGGGRMRPPPRVNGSNGPGSANPNGGSNDPAGSGSGGSAGTGAGRDPFNPGGSAGPGSAGGAGTAGSAGSAGPNPDDNDGIARGKNGTPGDPRRHSGSRHDRSFGDGGGASGNGDAGALGGIATVLLWGLVIVLALLLILAIVRQSSGVVGEEEPVQTADEEAEDPAKLLAVIEKPRDDADQLAHEGRYADAIHILLLRTLHELASQNMVRITPAMTSREVLARVPLLGDTRTALAGLVAAVEITWFGDEQVGAADYARCREQFELFAAAYRRGAAQQPPGALGARA